jgi:endonuclease/exonuclease/phosphatase family metal-dependent hydrolase
MVKKRLVGVVLLAVVVAGAICFERLPETWKDRIDGFFRPRHVPVVRTLTGPPAPRDADTVLIASFNIQVFGESKLEKTGVVAVLAEVIRQFDVVAVQEVRAKNQDVVAEFVRIVNDQGARYDYRLGPRLGRTESKEQYAFVFDTERIEVDPHSIYTVADPDDRLHRPPLVASFRARAPPPREAFTFTLVNIHTDPDEVKQELDALDDALLAVRHDGRGEDDIILLGDLNVDDRHLGQLGQLSGIAWAISGTPTNVRGTELYDNIVFGQAETVEFLRTAGVFDLKSAFGLSLENALKVSDHNPIWAQFSAYEGGARRQVANGPVPAVR